MTAMHKVKHMFVYFFKFRSASGRGILGISCVELWLSERLQITSLFHLPDAVSTFPPWVFMDVPCKAALNNAICPASVSSVPHLSLLLYSEFLPFFNVIFMQQSSDFCTLFQTSFTFSTRRIVPCDPRKCYDPLSSGSHECHPSLFLSLHLLMDLRVFSVSFSPDVFAH